MTAVLCGIIAVATFLLDPLAVAAERTHDRDAVIAARRVLQRVIGSRASSFDLAMIAGDARKDVFTLEAKRGRVTIAGTSAVALVRGAYHYLRTSCHCMVTWSGAQVDLPARLPDCEPVVIASPYECRQYYNVCTFGYSTVWWDWPRWEREIDWMALHGITMPLALVGPMGVWQRVWASYGVPRDSLRTFFSGPAFLPWHWMGNINGHSGPLPQGWIDAQEALQKQILGRMRELGMYRSCQHSPVLFPRPFTGNSPRNPCLKM